MQREKHTQWERISDTILLHREGNASAYNPQQANSKDRSASQSCTYLQSACNLPRWPAHGSARSGRGTPEADLVSSPLHASLPDLGCTRAGPA